MTRLRWFITGALLVALFWGCVPVYPGFSPRPEGPPSNERRTVLVLGDSTIVGAANRLPGILGDVGLPATVVNGAVPGTGQCDVGSGALIDRYDPDIIVAGFIGNVGGPPIGTSHWYARVRHCSRALVHAAGDVPVYWVVPWTVRWWCVSADVAWDWVAAWYVWGLEGVHLIDWRSPLSPGGSQATHLDFGGLGVLPVRLADCVHPTPLGERIAAEITVGRIRERW